MSMTLKRLIKEYTQLCENKVDGIEVNLVSKDDYMIWNAKIQGPKDTPFENGTFELLIRFNESYPIKPPAIQFLTPMFHPNIYNDGKICVSILQNDWSPIQNVRTILISIMSLLMDPNPNSPANAQAAQLYNKNRQEYYETVKTLISKKYL